MDASLESLGRVMMRQLLRENSRKLQRVFLKTELNSDWCMHVRKPPKAGERNARKDFRDPCPNFTSVVE